MRQNENNGKVYIFYYDDKINGYKENIKLLESDALKIKILDNVNICIIYSKDGIFEELTKKWDEIEDTISREYIKKYICKFNISEQIKNMLNYILLTDKVGNRKELEKINDINKDIKICALKYDNSVLIGSRENIISYLDDIIYQLDQIEDEKYDFTYVYRLIYNKAEEASKFLNDLYGNEVDKIKISCSKNSNMIILKTKNKTKLNEIVKVIRDYDVKPLQVLIKALIVEVKLDDSNRFGFEWKIGDQNQQGGFEANLRKTDNTLAVPLSGLRYSLLKGNKFDLFLNAAKNSSIVNILSKPQIMTRNNTPAKIVIGKEMPVIKLTSLSKNNNDNSTNNSSKLDISDLSKAQSVLIKYDLTNSPNIEAEYKDVGITLEVIPQISNNKTIMLDIKQIVSEVESLSLLDNPVIKKREATTSVIVNDNNTVVIGGMIKKDKTKTTKKVPLFSKLPLLGKALFTSEEEEEVNSELLIFITPEIIDENITMKSTMDLENSLIQK